MTTRANHGVVPHLAAESETSPILVICLVSCVPYALCFNLARRFLQRLLNYFLMLPLLFLPTCRFALGGGPEIFSTATPLTGNDLVYVNYWGNFNAAGYNFDPDAHEKPLITTHVTIIHHENTPDERQETLTVPLRRIGDLVFVRSLLIAEKK